MTEQSNSAEQIPAADEWKKLIIIPMKDTPVFPGLLTTLEVSDPVDIKILELCEKNQEIGLLLIRPESNSVSRSELQPNDFYTIGTVAVIKRMLNTIYGTKSIYVETISRFRIKEFISTGTEHLLAEVEYIKEQKLPETENKTHVGILKNLINQREDQPFLMENLKVNSNNISDAVSLTDFLCFYIIRHENQQELLEELNSKKRIIKLIKILTHDLDIQNYQKQILSSVSQKMNIQQREMFLREQMKVIKSEMSKLSHANNGEMTDPENSLNPSGMRQKLFDRIKALNLTGDIAENVTNEMNRLRSIDPFSAEANVIRTFLETVAALPWNTFSEESIDLKNAEKILNSDHYGIKDVKERILEFLAVRKLKNDTKGSIICLVGPPGTGKTSVGVSIAKALNKKYYRFSVGGLRDEAEIKGHRRTYIGAMPGQIIKGLMITKTKNPVFVIDEIDKLGISNQGDPASALLEALDPEQNSTFKDNYLDLPFDISNILFILTANTTESIPKPLLDRMECIQMSGYTSDEKLHIGKKYLFPKSLKKHGLTSGDVTISDSILKCIAEEYAREAGVRNFEKMLDKINRKIAFETVSDPEKDKPVKLNRQLVEKYLGKPVFREDDILKANRVGMSIGLAWTSMGGDVLAIEALSVPGRGEIKFTGQLGDVMKESANIAFTYVRNIAEKLGVDEKWFKLNNIHLHIPEGATPKDGPSAGITMAVALISMISGTIMAPDMAMTGELSLLGRVMPIGGLKEKILAAQRNKIKTIIIPADNKRDLDELDENVKKGIVFHTVSDMSEVITLAFPSFDLKGKK